MTKTRLAKAATVIMIMTLINKAVGFLRDSLVASAFGTTYQTDAYNMAMQICDILFIMIALAITTTFIPILSEVLTKKSKEEMFRFANNIINILLLISIFLVTLGFIFAPQIVRIIAPLFKDETYTLAVQLTKISIFSLVFLIINATFTAVLQTLDDFLGPAIVGVLLNLPIIIYIILGAKGGVVGLTVATVIGMSLRTLAQIPFLMKHGFKFIIIFDLKDHRVKKMVKLILPVIIGASANQINRLVNNALGSGLPKGSIAALGFGDRVSDVFYSIFAVAIVTVVFPALSRAINDNNKNEFKKYITSSVNNIFLFMIPCTVGILVLSVPIITILFKRGVFDDNSVYMTSNVLTFYAIGLPFYSIRDIFNRALYAMQDTKTSTYNGIISVLINIGLNLVLINFMGLSALPFSSSIAAAICAILLFKSLDNKIGNIEKKSIFKTTFKITLSSVIMGIVIWFIYKVTYHTVGGTLGILFGLVISSIMGIAVYSLALLVLKVDEFNIIWRELRKKVKR
ncbi:murein biosynthesis integral membrane protein MurJ [Clostridium sp.]|uniref:murein biosynthesis integral membrane protein MurJ n=1 Tax=Clostridium sp. TaxID=1506 RepID=UPI002FC60622